MKKLAMLSAILLFALATSPTKGAPSEVELQKNLDRSFSLEITGKPIKTAFKMLSKATGVKFKINEEIFYYLPYGDETCLSVGFHEETLREVLPAITSIQGITWKIKKDHVAIEPTLALKRFGRRATYKELALLNKLLTVRAKPLEMLNITPRQFINNALKDKNVKIIIPKFLEDIQKSLNAMTNANQALPGTLAEWLDMYCESDNLTWYIEKNTIKLISQKAQVQRQLNKKIDMNMKGVKLIDILTALKNEAKISMEMTPGVMLLLPAQTRNNFTIKVKQASIEDILQYIQGTTGLVFEKSNTGIVVKPSKYLTRSTGAKSPAAGPNYFLQFKIKTKAGGELTMYILPGQLPLDIQKELERQRQKYIEDLKKTLRSKK